MPKYETPEFNVNIAFNADASSALSTLDTNLLDNVSLHMIKTTNEAIIIDNTL